MANLTQIKINKNYVLFFDKHGSGFSGGFVVYPTITLFIRKNQGFYCMGLSFMYKTLSITLLKL